jgi:CheY-like chemotaxis protein
MEGMDGMALFDRIHAAMPTLPVIILTAHGTIPDAVTATQRGVFGFLTKPFDGKDLLAQVEQALKFSGGTRQRGTPEAWRAAIVTRSQRMEEVLRQAKLVAGSDASVLIFGESGSGKELLAQAIHLASVRAKGPFMAVNCAAIPEHLLESELFGHAKGAFSGAIYAHRGLFQAAQGGTLFLDEIGDMPLALQAKLLRALQDRSVRPVGSTEMVPVDVRIISATHRDLSEGIRSGAFRPDLYYRLNVVSLALPPAVRAARGHSAAVRTFRRTACGALQQACAHLRPGGDGIAGECLLAGQRAPTAQRGRADRCAVDLSRSAGLARAAGLARRQHHDGVARRSAACLRARLPGAAAARHRGQCHPGGAHGAAQSHRVLQAAATARSDPRVVQDRTRLKKPDVSLSGTSPAPVFLSLVGDKKNPY